MGFRGFSAEAYRIAQEPTPCHFSQGLNLVAASIKNQFDRCWSDMFLISPMPLLASVQAARWLALTPRCRWIMIGGHSFSSSCRSTMHLLSLSLTSFSVHSFPMNLQ